MGSRKIASLMKSKSGASLAFFLAVMFLLMIISSSVLVVASNARSTGLERQKSKQIEVLAQSVTKSLNKAIIREGEFDENLVDEGGFGKEIVLELYKAKKNNTSYTGFNIEATLDTAVLLPPNITIEDIIISIPADKQKVEIVEGVPAIKDEAGLILLPSIPEKTYISFQMTATVTCKDTTNQTLKSSLSYDYSNGYLEDGNFVPQIVGGEPYLGKWEVKAYAQNSK